MDRSEREYTTDHVVEIMKSVDDEYEPHTSIEIADELGCSRQTVYDRLVELENAGKVNTKKVGSRGRVWWINR